MAKNDRVQFPSTQQYIADALGISLVHTNKTLRRLVTGKVVRWKDKVFEILDRDKLIEIAGYDFNEKQPRPFI